MVELDIQTHNKKLDTFSIDSDGKNRWQLTGYAYITYPGHSSNPNPFACMAYVQNGYGYCHACGHYIVNHFFVGHPEKGGSIVGSECIKKVLGASAEGAVKRAVARVNREYKNKLRNLKLLEDCLEWFDKNPDMHNLTTGEFRHRWGCDFKKCPHREDEKDKVCWKVPMMNGDIWDELKVENIVDKEWINPECEDMLQCKEYDPYHPQWHSEELIKMVRTAFDRNHKNIQYIFDYIENFNTHLLQTGFRKYTKELPTKIPKFELRTFKKQPMTEGEKAELEKLTQAEINKVFKIKEEVQINL